LVAKNAGKVREGKTSEKGFVRDFGLLDATMIVAGSMIGSGIFIVPADIARLLGSSGWIIAAWVLTGLITICGAVVYGDLARMMPGAGGMYVYLREAYSPLGGFLYGWTLFLVIQTGTVAAVAVGFARFLGILTPSVSGTGWIVAPINLSENYAISLSTQQLAAVLSILALTLINTFGVRLGKWIQNSLTGIKIATLSLLILLCFTIGFNGEVAAANFSNMFSLDKVAPGSGMAAAGGLAALLVALCLSQVGSLFSSDAWHNVTYAGDEVKDARKILPKAMVLGTVLVIGLYIVVNVAYMVVLPIAGIQTAPDDRVGTAALAAIFGGKGAIIMAAAIVISTLGANNGLILSGARVYYVMAKDSLFFRSTGKLNDSGVPGMALILQAVWAAFLVLPRIRLRDAAGNEQVDANGLPLYGNLYGDLLNYVVFAVLLFYIATVLGYLKLRKTRPVDDTEGRTAGHDRLLRLLPWAYTLMAGPITLVLLFFQPKTSLPGLALVATGIPVYYLWRKFSAAKT
jgi:APA family basic amino acid/polyamine antiporter